MKNLDSDSSMLSIDENLTEQEKDKEEEDDELSSSNDTEIEDEQKQPTKQVAKTVSPPTAKILSSPKAKVKDPKSLVLNVAFINKEDYSHVYKLCKNNVIFHKFRTWMDREVNSTVKSLKINCTY